VETKEILLQLSSSPDQSRKLLLYCFDVDFSPYEKQQSITEGT
jgi:hypothetical protein